MSEIDKIFGEREARRVELEQQRRERVAVASSFLKAFFETDVAPSKTLAGQGIEGQLTDTALVLHRAGAGMHSDPFIIALGPDGEIDCAGRSLGRYTDDLKVKMKRELVGEILNFFDL